MANTTMPDSIPVVDHIATNGVLNHHNPHGQHNHNHNHNHNNTHHHIRPDTHTFTPNTTTTNATSSPSPDISPDLDLASLVSALHTKIQSFLSQSFPPETPLARAQSQTRHSLSIITTALKTYPLPALSLSYNGGKDCLVMLVLFLSSLHPLPPPSAGGISRIPAIYALPPDPFPSIEEFVFASSRTYHLDISKYTTDPPSSTLKSSFEDYLNRNPKVQAIFVGTRRTDPHGANLKDFDRTDRGWPDFVRINPVLDWHYAEIWAFIRFLGLRYCSLYDEGYTSLGGTGDTHPNPRLRVGLGSVDGKDDEEGSQQYRPAYELTEDLEERLGRA